MLLDLKAHYLDLIVTAAEAAGGKALHRPGAVEGSGEIYMTRSAKETASQYVIAYRFEDRQVVIGVQFRDARTPFAQTYSYAEGLDAFWPDFARALLGNRIEHKATTGKEVSFA